MDKGIEKSAGKILGLSEGEYSAQALKYSKGIIILWLVTGLVYNLMTGNLVSLSSVLLVLPGTLIVSLASIPFFLLSIKKDKTIRAMEERERTLRLIGKRPERKKDVPAMLLFTLVTIAELTFPIIAAIVFLRLAR